MNKVADAIVLPQELAGLRAALLRIFSGVLPSLNQAAEGRIWAHSAVAVTNTTGVGTTVVLVAPSAPMTQTLPSAEDMVGSIVIVKRANSTTHTVTVNATDGSTFDGAASDSLTTSRQFKGWYSDGSQYHRVI